MPYLEEERQTLIDDRLILPETPGDLNYKITTCLIGYIRTHGLRYQTINDILGALEGAKQEFYFRVAFPYECEKRTTNPDVYADIAPGE